MWTTEILVERPAARTSDGVAIDPYDGAPAEDPPDDEPTSATPNTTVADDVHAVIGKPNGKPESDGAQRSQLDNQLVCDVIPLLIDDIVIDKRTKRVYVVQWVEQRTGLDLDHTLAGVRRNEAVRV